MIFRVTVFLLVVRLVVVVLRTTIVTSTSPQRPAEPGAPVKLFVAVTIFVFGVALAVAAAQALTFGRARAVAPRTAAVALFAVVLLSLGEGEAFEVDVAAWHAGGAEVAADRVDHRGRAAEEDVALGRIRDELAQVLGREQPRSLAAVVADHVVDDEAASAVSSSSSRLKTGRPSPSAR